MDSPVCALWDAMATEESSDGGSTENTASVASSSSSFINNSSWIYSWTSTQISDIFRQGLFSSRLLDLRSIRNVRLVCKRWKSLSTIPCINISSINVRKHPSEVLEMVQSSQTVRFTQISKESPFAIHILRPIFSQIYHPSSSVDSLIFQGCSMSPALSAFVADELRQNGKAGKILSLKFYATQLEDFGVTSVCNALRHSQHIHEISFCNVAMGDLGFRALAAFIGTQMVRNKLNKHQSLSQSVSASPKFISASENLNAKNRSNHVTHNRMFWLDYLSSNSHLETNECGITSLELRECAIHPRSCAAIATAIKRNNTLKRLNIGGVGFSDQVVGLFADCIANHPSLTEFSIRCPIIEEPGIISLIRAFEMSPKLQIAFVSNVEGEKWAHQLIRALKTSSPSAFIEVGVLPEVEYITD